LISCSFAGEEKGSTLTTRLVIASILVQFKEKKVGLPKGVMLLSASNDMMDYLTQNFGFEAE